MSAEALLAGNTYPGRGIIVGRSGDGESAVVVYFIMGRSENSRNRVFTKKCDGLVTEAADAAKMKDPSLIIYSPVRVLGYETIVTNGDQTDTIYNALCEGGDFISALRTREFEPDAPNFTPRISGIVHIDGGTMACALSILKTDGEHSERCMRYFYEYAAPIAGEGRLIHTYDEDGDPLPSFVGEPRRISLEGAESAKALAQRVWESLNRDNRVALFARFINIKTGRRDDEIINRFKKI